MRLGTKIFTGGMLFFVMLIGGCLFTMRGCLSKYDERFALPPVLYFEKNGNSFAISLVKFSKTTSSSQRGGFTSRSYDYLYFIQKNNAVTGEKLLSRKIDVPDRLKYYPEEMLGASANRAWIFLDELMAFDAETLEKIADKKSIEAKNPALKGWLPDERRYYQFDNSDSSISFTAKNGAKWTLNTTTLIASPKEEIGKAITDHNKSAYVRKLERMQEMNINFNEMIINQDTINKKWLGIYSKNEMAELREAVSLTTAYKTDSRRQIFYGSYNNVKENNAVIDKANLINLNTSAWFLDGGFLLDKQTAKPIWLTNPEACLVIYKNEIGREAKLMLCRVAANGKILWQLDTGLRNWIDWSYTGNRLFISGNNKSSDNNRCSIFLSVNLDSGIISSYDYFADSKL
jgi:hypothetical protein